jgi:4-hydroxy-tetrahydrodipicolinate synthase
MQDVAETLSREIITLNFNSMKKDRFNNGFYAALGTPTDTGGILAEEAFEKEIELMIASGTAGLLCMGSMGRMESIRDSEYPKVAEKCTAFVKGRVPVLVGVMDCSAARVIDRINALGNMEIEGVVATAPFYSKVSIPGIVNFFRIISEKSRYPVFIYDLPSVTQSSITKEILEQLMVVKNIRGLKTANLNMILDLKRNNSLREDFSIFFSGLDSFDAAIKAGIKKNLDGMFTCTPFNSKRMYGHIEEEDAEDISGYLNNILRLRNIFLKEDVLAAYSFAMELLGCPGIYHCDYSLPVSGKLKEEIFSCMKSIKEI